MFDRTKRELKKFKASMIYNNLYKDYKDFYDICSKKPDFDGEVNGFCRCNGDKIDEDVLDILNYKAGKVGAHVTACLIQNPKTNDIYVLYHMEKQLEGYKVVDLEKYRMNKEFEQLIKDAEDRAKKYSIR